MKHDRRLGDSKPKSGGGKSRVNAGSMANQGTNIMQFSTKNFRTFQRKATKLGLPSAPRSRALTGVAGIALTVAVAATMPFFAKAATEPQPVVAVASPCTDCKWSTASIDALIAEIAAAQSEGLEASAYDAAGLRLLVREAGPGAALDARADTVALMLARHYLLGRVEERSRQNWYIARADDQPEALAAGLRTALANGKVQPWLRSLLPSDSRYAALRTAYTALPAVDLEGRERVRANLERWRWMPRDLGANHILVNVPSYTLSVVEGGVPVSSYVVVVGAPSTPTPQMSAIARTVVVNPSWNVPPSIIRSSNMRVGKPGFVTANRGGAISFTQPPGPSNALGRIKIDMPNPDAIYLHDTQAKSLFERPSRAFSHGCIRVKNIAQLASELVTRDSGDPQRVTAALRGFQTTPVALHTSRPVFIVYFTVEVGPNGTLIRHEDPYGRDARLNRVLAKLDLKSADRTAFASAARADTSL